MTRSVEELLETIPSRRVELLLVARVLPSCREAVCGYLWEHIDNESQWTRLFEEVTEV